MALSKPKAYNLERLCLQLNSNWQYADLKLNGGLVSIQEDAPIPQTLRGPTPDPDRETCTIYTVIQKERVQGRKSMTVKNFFDGFKHKSLSFKEKESIYWKIRLRYGCGIIPIAVIYMAKRLKKIGYTSWELPNGKIIPFDSLWLITFRAVPNDVNVVRPFPTMKSIMNFKSVDETLEVFGPDFGNGRTVQYTILGAVMSSGEKYVVDPTSLQFGLRKDGKKLLYYGTWEEYMEAFPGKHFTLVPDCAGWKNDDCIQELVDKFNDAYQELMYRIGNRGRNPKSPGFMDDLIEKTMKVIDEPFCAHCGETGKFGVKFRLMSCSKCKTTFYCDGECQTMDWKFHKSNSCCVKKI